MIRGVHTMFYSSEAEAFRAFMRDKLGFPATDPNLNCSPFTVMYVPSGNAWTGRNMGGYEGFGEMPHQAAADHNPTESLKHCLMKCR